MHPSQPRFERFTQHMPYGSDVTLLTLKGHLLAEEILDDIIRSKCTDLDALKGVELSFFVKSRLVRALFGRPLADKDFALPERLWSMIESLNELRNDLAHRLESKKLQARIDKFISFAAGETPPDASLTQEVRLSKAIAFLLGYLAAFEHFIKTGEVPKLLPKDA